MRKLLSFSKPQRGFTLIELVIVIAIISVLIATGAVSYSTIQRNARNDQRQSDLQKIAAALEEYYADNSGYPTTAVGIYVGTGCITDGANCTSGRVYLDPTPKDPGGAAVPYGYSATDNDTIVNRPQKYTLTATKEPSGNLTVSSPTH